MVNKTEVSLVGENTFGDDLEENLPTTQGASGRDEYPSSGSSDPIKRLEEIEGTYRLVPPNHNVTIEVAFRYKPSHSGAFFADSRFIIWRDRSVLPNVYYWERTQGSAAPSPYKYGPFKEISGAFEGMKDTFNVSTFNTERIT